MIILFLYNLKFLIRKVSNFYWNLVRQTAWLSCEICNGNLVEIFTW